MRERAAAVQMATLLASSCFALTLAGCGSNGCPQGAATCVDAAIDTARETGRDDRGAETSADGNDDIPPADAPADDGRDAPDDTRDALDDGRDAPIEATVTDAPAQDGGPISDGGIDSTDARLMTDGGGSDAGPPTETSKCAVGRVRVHVRDIWSQGVTPSLGLLPGPAAGVLLQESERFNIFGARLDSAVDVAGGRCAYYSACIPNTTTKVNVGPLFPTGCPHISRSAAIDISAVNRSGEFWIEYTGTSATLAADYAQTPMVPVGAGKFQVTADPGKLVAPACKIGTPAPQIATADTMRVHFRWPWTAPIKTGYPGAPCGDDGLGYSPPPYPTSLAVMGLNCSPQAFLEFQDGNCTWYSALIPRNSVSVNADAKFWFQYPDLLVGLQTTTITLPSGRATALAKLAYGSPAGMNSSPK